jgi:hypothetical protein
VARSHVQRRHHMAHRHRHLDRPSEAEVCDVARNEASWDKRADVEAE